MHGKMFSQGLLKYTRAQEYFYIQIKSGSNPTKEICLKKNKLVKNFPDGEIITSILIISSCMN